MAASIAPPPKPTGSTTTGLVQGEVHRCGGRADWQQPLLLLLLLLLLLVAVRVRGEVQRRGRCTDGLQAQGGLGGT